jgi:TolB-like protein/DNA-binding winged helix-turn-helix (wHTH) protein
MIYHFADCALDTNLCTLQRDGQTYRLRLKVFRMCLYLLEHRDRVVSRDELCTQVWPGQFVSQATLEGVIRLVRQAVGDSGRTQRIIQTLHGHGYRFVADVEERSTTVAASVIPPASGVLMAQGASALSQTTGVNVALGSAPAPESTPDPVWPGKPSRGTAFEEEYVANSHARIAPREQQTAGLRSPRRLPGARVVQAMAVLILSLLGGWGLWQGVREGKVIPLEKSRIAVLPFIDLSAEADQAYFADGLTEELIAQLSQIQGLTVIARTAVMKYKGTRKDVATIGRELRVGTILEGSVRAGDNQMRINAQLIDVISQGHLWSQEYDRELTGAFGIQKDIATRVAQQLKGQLRAGWKQRIEEQNTANHDAYTLNLQGR